MPNSFAYKKGMGILPCLEQHLESNTFLKTDIHEFFNSINYEKPTDLLLEDSVCKRNQWSDIQQPGYGRGPSAVMTEFGKLLNNLNDVVEAGYNVVILAHSKMRKFEEPNEAAAYDRWEGRGERRARMKGYRRRCVLQSLSKHQSGWCS